jgi:hypothetical protein
MLMQIAFINADLILTEFFPNLLYYLREGIE